MALRNRLEKLPWMGVSVEPSETDAHAHLVKVSFGEINIGAGDAAVPFMAIQRLDESQQQGACRVCEAMLDLCYDANRAASAYRMSGE